MKYIIHACPKRMWYVEEYLVPSLISQGINKEDIDIWNDDKQLGNLRSFILACDYYGCLGLAGGAWHLQDDIILSRDFRDKSISSSASCQKEDAIICGYYNRNYAHNPKKIEFNTFSCNFADLPDSFQCIYIPFALLKEVRGFIETAVLKRHLYQKRYAENKYDDFFFKRFLLHKVRNGADLKLYVFSPTLVEHVGDLIGGSIANTAREKTYNNKSYIFCDADAFQDFKHFLEGREKT